MTKRDGTRDNNVATWSMVGLAAVAFLLMAIYAANAHAQGPEWCNVNAPDREFKTCIAKQASAALELRAEVKQLNDRIAALERRGVGAGLSKDDDWKQARNAAYQVVCELKVVRCQ